MGARVDRTFASSAAAAVVAAGAPISHEGRDALLKRLEAAPQGLTDFEAQQRLRRYGPNLAVPSLRRGTLVKSAQRLVEPLIAILLVAALISGVTGDWQSFIIIVVIVLASINSTARGGAGRYRYASYRRPYTR